MPVSEAVQATLKPYQIGEKIRGLRIEKGWGLVEVGRQTGLSAALLSKIERGKLIPTLPTLTRIAMVFGVGLEIFFSSGNGRPAIHVVRHDQHPKPVPWTGGSAQALAEELARDSGMWRHLQFQQLRFAANSAPEQAHQHPGQEWLYLLGGALRLRVGEQEHEMAAGDMIGFDSSQPHEYTSVEEAQALMLTLEP
jgi:DNA-binding XRE family transcriptional regulator